MRRESRLAICVLAVLLAAGSPASTAVKKGGKKRLGGIVQRTATSHGSGNEVVVSATATCPRKTRAVTGGFSLQPALSQSVIGVVYESVRASARSWRSSAQIAEPTAPDDVVTLTTTVSCRRNAPKLKTVATTLALPATTPSTVSPTVTATCPKGSKAFAGGFATGKPVIPGTDTTGSSVTDSYRAGARGWATKVFYGGPATSLTTHAYCARVRWVPVASGGSGTTVSDSLAAGGDKVNCAKSLSAPSALGGGFVQTAAPAAPYGWFAIRSSLPRKGSWEVVGDHLAQNPTTLGAMVYCGR